MQFRIKVSNIVVNTMKDFSPSCGANHVELCNSILICMGKSSLCYKKLETQIHNWCSNEHT